jgi:hypothetical protein
MFKYLVATLTGLLVVSPSSAQPDPSAQSDSRVFELRTYTAGADRLNELHARFRDHTVRLLERHGATNLGYWVPADNSDNKLMFLLSYPSQTARDRTWSALAADPEWLRAKRTSQLREGKLVDRIESTFLTATAYSPTIRAARDPDDREFELRTATAAAGQAEALHAKLRTDTIPELERNGTAVVGVWTVRKSSGNDTTVMYLVARKPGVGESEADSVLVSLSGVGLRRPSPRPDPSILLLRPTDYSPMK